MPERLDVNSIPEAPMIRVEYDGHLSPRHKEDIRRRLVVFVPRIVELDEPIETAVLSPTLEETRDVDD